MNFLIFILFIAALFGALYMTGNLNKITGGISGALAAAVSWLTDIGDKISGLL